MILGAVFALCAAISAGISHVLIRVGTQHGKSTDILAIVLLVNLVVFLPVAAVGSFPLYEISWRSGLAFAASGIAGTILGRSFSYEGIRRIGASRSQTIVASQSLHAALIAAVVLGESVTSGHLIGILLIMSGVIMISHELRTTQAAVLARVSRMSFLFPLAAAFFYGIEPIFAKIGLTEGTPILVGLAIKSMTATVVLFGYSRGRGILMTHSGFGRLELRWYIGAGLFNSLFLLCYFRALEVAPVVLVVPIVQLIPLVVIGLSFLFLQRLEVVTWKVLLAAMIVVAGAIIVTWSS